MNYEEVKNEFIKLKKEELAYIDQISKISRNKILSEYEKIEIYRTLNKYAVRIDDLFKKLFNEAFADKQKARENLNDIIIEFEVDENYLDKVEFYCEQHKKIILEDLGIDAESFKFKLTLSDLLYMRRSFYTHKEIDWDIILNNQKLIENPIYIFCGFYDSSEDCYGPCFGNRDYYLYVIYENICSEYGDKEEIRKKNIEEFEKDRTIIYSKRYVRPFEIRKIFKEELLNVQNETLNDCVTETKNRIEELNYTRSPEYKEKILLDRINELYQKVKGQFIKKEILYSGEFIDVLRETYQLPNEKTVEKEKIVKNEGKNSVIVISITQNKEYIITFQNRIKDEMIAEFPSGYIENDEEPIEAAKRELKEETGYVSDDLFIVDQVYTSPSIDNSVTYIVIANNCTKTDERKVDGTELINYGLFSENELNYLINKNIMNGAMNKLAYYNLVNNVDDCNVTHLKSNKRIYKKLKKKRNPLNN